MNPLHLHAVNLKEYTMKRNGFRTVVVLALTIFLLNAPVCATASRLQDTCAEARDEVALRPEWMRILHDTLPICKISIPGSHDSGSIKGGHMLKTQSNRYSCPIATRHPRF